MNNMRKQRLIKYLRKHRLMCIVKSNYKSRVCYTRGYIIVDNNLEHIGDYQTSAHAKGRVFACYLAMLRAHNIKLDELEDYKQIYKECGGY